MILGCDHVSQTWHGGACDNLVFLEQLPNHPSKKPLLREWLPYHDIGLTNNHAGPVIELTDHWSRPNPSTADKGFIPMIVNGAPAILRGVNDIEGSVGFFQEILGVEPRGRDDEKQAASFMIPDPIGRGETQLVLVKNAQECEALKLDDEGWPCLALLTTKCEAQFDITVNGRTFGIEFKVGPSGEIVELMELRRKWMS